MVERRRVVLATRNRDKLREIEKLLDSERFELLTLDDFEDFPEVVEDGGSLEENALKKAREVAAVTGLLAVADDTGLEVDALGGRPGVFSSRYAGENATYADNVHKLLVDLQGVPDEKRTARFRCVAAIVDGDREVTVEGICEGVILKEPRGSGGFGYDPVFYVPSTGKTFAEMEPAEKNTISHRGRAFRQVAKVLLNWESEEPNKD